jgi:ferredoxin
MRLGLAPRYRRTNSPGGNPSPPLRGTVRRGRCQSRDAVPPTPVRLTRRALKGGPATPSICFLVTLQDFVEALGRRGAIPATVNGMVAAPARTNPRRALWQQLLRCGACGTGRCLTCHCARTDRRQQPPRACLKTSRPSAALPPSKLLLFGYKIRHDGRIAARTVQAAAYSTA